MIAELAETQDELTLGAGNSKPFRFMHQKCGITLFGPRGQCIPILLTACQKLGGNPSKNECLNLIDGRHWFNKDDLGQDPPFMPETMRTSHVGRPSQKNLTRGPE
jgi:hypothetical protein